MGKPRVQIIGSTSSYVGHIHWLIPRGPVPQRSLGWRGLVVTEPKIRWCCVKNNGYAEILKGALGMEHLVGRWPLSSTPERPGWEKKTGSFIHLLSSFVKLQSPAVCVHFVSPEEREIGSRKLGESHSFCEGGLCGKSE